TWQAIGNKITYHNSSKTDELKNLDVFHLFKPTDKRIILKENEKLFFYHPIKFIEILYALLNPDGENESEMHAAPAIPPAPKKEDTDCIKRLKEKGIVNNKEFRPDDPVKRCEFLKMLFLALEYSVPDKGSISNTFSDVNQNDWFAPYVFLANQCKIAQGYRYANGQKTGIFGPFDNTTIDQALKMGSVAKHGHEGTKKNEYEINGKKSGPDIVSREQAATLICNLLDDNESENHIANRRDELVRRIEGPKNAEIDKTIIYKVVQYAQQNPTQSQKNSINWVIKEEDADKNKTIESFSEKGEKLEYTPSSELSGKIIRIIAYTNKQSLESSVLTCVGDNEEITYLAKTIYGEARGENRASKLAVAWSIRNRTGKNRWWGNTYKEVTTKKWQFSCWLESDSNYDDVQYLHPYSQ
ncbi:Cell wall hydrolase, SleB domain protein, partial [Candidatus Magnetomorum sp. HK-1]